MDRAEQLHFQRLPAEAQYEALWRLALSGLTVEQVAERTGWSPERIRQTINPEPPPAIAPWRSTFNSTRAGSRRGPSESPRPDRAPPMHRR
jgi:hypothetical protein